MSTITKERLTELSRRENVGAILGEEIAELARIALASLEAEPVCVIDQSNLDYLKSGSDADVWPASRTEMGDVLLYRTAPPAPVSVPAAMEMDDDFDSAFEHGKAVGWNAYRAAMLQGADGNAPAHFRSRPAQSSLSPAQGGNSPVIPDGWMMVPVEPTPDMREAYHQAQAEYEDSDGLWSPDHQWQAMLAAAPQQEVKP
ncbi:hypothetical protein M8S81_07770 [Enterobacter hormaechei]|jgi:hypothetical protein|nr:hypothetical protein [Enterobacter hormaechei]